MTREPRPPKDAARAVPRPTALGTAGDGEVLVRVKVVPGASRDALAGAYGDRLRVKVAAPPEGGRANEALLALLARRLGVSPRAVRLVSGATTPLKVVGVRGLALPAVAAALDLPA